MVEMGELQFESWIENIENELKNIPKTSIMKSKSSIYALDLDQVGKELLKKKFVGQLHCLWTLCHYSSKQKKAFEHICCNLQKGPETETKILAFYDIEIKNLNQYYENNKQIFDLINLYKQQITKKNNTLSESEKTMLTKNSFDTEKRLKKLDAHYRLLNGKCFYTHGRTISEYIESLTKEKVN